MQINKVPIAQSPRDADLPHDTWRPNQYDMYRIVAEQVEARKDDYIQLSEGQRDNHIGILGQKIYFGSLAVGSGKSAVASGLALHDRVLVLVHTLALLDQYRDKYGFAVIKGRQEYSCELRDKVELWKEENKGIPTAADCHYSNMHKCPAAGVCGYLIAKKQAMGSEKTACTYRYAAMSANMQGRTGILVMDEVHSAAEELVAFNEFTTTPDRIARLDLPPFPFRQYGENGLGDVIDGVDLQKVSGWMRKSRDILNREIGEEDDYLDPDDAAQAMQPNVSRLKRFRDYLQRTLERIPNSEWFLIIENNEIHLKALDAKDVVERIIRAKHTVLGMSGTIGDPAPLAKEMGFDEYEHHDFPHPIPVEARPVSDLKVKPLNWNNLQANPNLYRIQAVAIANWIRGLPVEFRGLILTSSYLKIKKLYEFLPELLPEHKFIVQSDMSPSMVAAKFLRNEHPSEIVIGTVQGLGTGLDATGDIARFIVIAGVSHPSPKDRYAKARRERQDGISYQHWATFSQIMQASGRVTRGMLDENGEFMVNHIAIADGMAVNKIAMKNYASWFKEAIQ